MTDIVMIPALGCDARLYEPVAAALAPIVQPQTLVAGGDRMESCVAQILAAAPRRFVALGTSFGGRVALELALAAPERIAGLVVIGSSSGPSPDPAVGHRRSARLRAGEFETVVAEMAAIITHLPGPRGPAARDDFIAMARSRGADLMARQSDALAHRGDLRPHLSAIACPALMIWGDHDQFVPPADGRALAAAVANGRYVEIAGCGHLPTLEAPEATAAAIAGWLADGRLT